MKTCVFFGHREYGGELDAKIYSVAKNMVLQNSVDNFYIGHNGNFDKAALRAVQRIATEFEYVRYTVVLSDLSAATVWQDKKVSTIFPQRVAEAPARFRIDRRNRFMLSAADFAITYVKYPFGGAAKYKTLAVKNGVYVVEISDDTL